MTKPPMTVGRLLLACLLCLALFGVLTLIVLHFRRP
jgi:hypothetical protein